MLAREEPATEFRGRVYDSILDTIGATPLVRLRRLTEQEGVSAEIFGKCEFFNPLASVKDRIAVSMIEAAERDGRLRPGTVVVEPTSGNTGIGLAFVCAAKGYRVILVMPDSMSVERRRMLALLGAELELTPAANGITGAIARTQEIIAGLPDAIMLDQFGNPQSGDPPKDDGRRNLARHWWRGRHRCKRRRDGRYAHWRRGSVARAQTRIAHGCRGADGQRGSVGQSSRTAQDPRHRRRYHSRNLE